MIDEFVDAAFSGIDPDARGAGIAQAMRSMPAQLPDDPTTEQVEAWIELAELVSEPSFRARVSEGGFSGWNCAHARSPRERGQKIKNGHGAPNELERQRPSIARPPVSKTASKIPELNGRRKDSN